MSKIKLSELRPLIHEEIIRVLLEFETKDMPNGTSWKVAGKGWAAKNTNGVTNYWYGKDEVKNKEAASAFAKDSTKQPKQHTGDTPKSQNKGIQQPSRPSKPTIGA